MWILEVTAPRLVRAPRYPRQIARPTIDPHDAATCDISTEPRYRHSFATVRRDCGRAVATLGVSEDLSSPMKAHSWATLQAVCLGKNLGARSVPQRPWHPARELLPVRDDAHPASPPLPPLSYQPRSHGRDSARRRADAWIVSLVRIGIAAGRVRC